MTDTKSLAVEHLHRVPTWAGKNRLPALSLPGARLFAQIGCLNCHTYLGTGGGFAGAHDLSKERLKHGLQWLIRQLRCPSCLKAGSVMPSFRALGARRIRQVALFLAASKGGK